MAQTSRIEWTQMVWNPISGCSKVSTGCKHCYAETLATRFWGERKFTDVRLHLEKLEEPLRRKKPTTYFVNSMSDLFHEAVPDEFIDRLFCVMFQARRHRFIVLTKRADRMPQFFARDKRWIRDAWPLRNVILGVSCENQATTDERIPLLLATPAACRMVSLEPLLKPVELMAHLRGLGWVVIGGESGPRARPCNVDWVRSIVRQCKEAGAPCFVKQLGRRPIMSEREIADRTSGWSGEKRKDVYLPLKLLDRKGGDMSEWPSDLRVRRRPAILEGK